MDLLQLFQSLVLPGAAASGNQLSAVPIPGAASHRLAKDASSCPCLLIRQSPSDASSAPIRLENLLVAFDVSCTVVYPEGEAERGTFTIVRCTASNPALFPHFLRVISPLIAVLGPTPTRAAVRRAVSGLVELFQALAAPAKKTVQGLWAELFVIRVASDPTAMAAAWHRDPLEHFDFSAGSQRIEVKSTSTRRREHHFSLAQLAPPKGTQVLVASLFVERSGGGASLQHLCDGIRALLVSNSELTAHFDATFYASLGSGWEDVLSEAFDLELARESLALFSADAVPAIGAPIPPFVSNIRFCSDLSQVTALRREEIRAAGGLFASAAPD